MAIRRLPSAAIAAALLLTAVSVHTGAAGGPSIEASGNGLFDDPDGDMVPNCIEIVAQTDPRQADSDMDEIDDFEEILTFTSHDAAIPTKPIEHSMRVLVTSSTRPGGESDVYLHLMLRFVNLGMEDIAFHGFYVNLGGEEVSLMNLIGYGELRFSQRNRARDGVSYLFSIRLSSEQDLYRILPCTVGARAVLGGRLINTGSLLMPSSLDIAALLPYGRDSLILQPVSTTVHDQDSNPYYGKGGRVCELGLSAVGAGVGGTICEVDSAKCKVAAGLRCSSSCPQRRGTTVVIPDGLGTITGNH